jgi:hypothetical protein
MEPRHEIDKGILRDQLADVEDGAAPGILITGHIQVGFEAEYSSIRERLLVQIL